VNSEHGQHYIGEKAPAENITEHKKIGSLMADTSNWHDHNTFGRSDPRLSFEKALHRKCGSKSQPPVGVVLLMFQEAGFHKANDALLLCRRGFPSDPGKEASDDSYDRSCRSNENGGEKEHHIQPVHGDLKCLDVGHSAQGIEEIVCVFLQLRTGMAASATTPMRARMIPGALSAIPTMKAALKQIAPRPNRV
jgi:hypothetical protein